MTRTRKKILAAFIALFLAGGAAAYFWQDGQDAKKTMQTAPVVRATIEESISAQGKLEPKDYVDIGVQVSGQILKLYVDIGDVVTKGQLLAELDPRTFQAAIDSSKAQIRALDAQIRQQSAQLDYDRAQFTRASNLVDAGGVSRDDLEAKQAALKISEATIESLSAQKEKAEADLQTNTINLGYTKIYTPMDGIVSDRKANEGQTLNANQTTPTIMQVADLNVMTVRAEIAEADVMSLSQGMESTFTTLGDVDRKWTGVIRQILPTPEVINDVVLYNALIDVDNKDGKLMNGMSTQNDFIIAHAKDALVIPVKALKERLEAKDNDNGKAYLVTVMKGGNFVEREVRIGIMTRTKVEVRSGLQEGDLVVVSDVQEGIERKKDTGPPIPGAARL